MKKIFILSSFVLGAIIFVSSSAVAVGPIETKRERQKRERKQSAGAPADLYQKIHESFLRENYAETDRVSREYLSGSPSQTPHREDVLYLQALSLLKLRRGNEARERLKDLENAFGSAHKRAEASASIGDTYFYEGDVEKARESYSQTLQKYPGSDQTPYLNGRLQELSLTHEKRVNGFPLRQNGVEESQYFSVQVGSFSKVKNAQALVGKLKAADYDAFLAESNHDAMNRVRVGKFTSREDAAKIEKRLKREGYPTKIVS